MIVWKTIDGKDGHHDKAAILDRALEQSAYAGIGAGHSDLCDRRLVHFGIVRLLGLPRNGDYGGALLNGRRIAFEPAVRMVKEELGRPRSSQTEVHSPTQPDLCGIQCYLLDTYNTSLHQGN